jgi:phospholipid/cholesterol/gamma-HCH transport system permease protein
MQAGSAALASPAVAITGKDDRWALTGELDIRTLTEGRRALAQWLKERKSRSLDLGELHGLDTPGALALCELRGKGVELTGIRDEHKALLDLVCNLDLKTLPASKSVPRWRQLVIELGRGAHDAWHDAYDVTAFIGRAVGALGHALIHPRYLRPPSISRHIEETGIHALPIVGLMAVMISVVIGYQGVVQLRPLGAEDFTINLVAVSVLREMGVLITAIMVAGRSGSAFAAEIGVMKAREEIDALEVMGIDPMQVLVVPRLIGLIVALPLLTFFADIMGLFGGAMVTQTLLGIAPLQYVDRVHQAIDARDAFVGLVKAPIFAFIIAVIGCMHGLRVRGSAESVGQETTRAVVKSIFLVIVLDALFSILFEKLGL